MAVASRRCVVKAIVCVLCLLYHVPQSISTYMPNAAEKVLKNFIQQGIWGNRTLNSHEKQMLINLWSFYVISDALGALLTTGQPMTTVG